ncbi:YcnI family copper-binding membrane protein [Nocardioides mangrovi]|uniref:YcnI family protein n=1 Tax=Nocardioides mangrovi TaxID=2874580 RepID=A0ABS7UA99_9ACTN|nr:YcnI family protein [Nocardioides mangrovi]MBZ5737765.1 YcnI family protein [Nocardioides mangrovi]
MKLSRTHARLAVVPAAVAVIGLALAGPASAHVTVTPSTTAAGAYTILTVSVPHGCDGSPTTKVAVKVPEDIIEVTPTRNPFYDVEKVTTKLDKPITAEDGDQITERTSQVVYTAKTPLPDGQRDAFELSLQIPEDDAGKTLVFPAIQTCEQGQTAWTEVPAAGQSEDDLEHPAPSFEVTAADGSGSAESASTGGTTAAADSDADDSGNGLAIAGLVAGLLGLVLGGAALVRTRTGA